MCLFVHADCLSGGNCRSLLLNTDILLSTASIPPFSLATLTFSLCDSTPVSILSFLTRKFRVLIVWSKGLLTICLQPLLAEHRSMLIDCLFMHCQCCPRLHRLTYSHLVQTFQNTIFGHFTCRQQSLVPSCIKINNVVAFLRDTKINLSCKIKSSFMSASNSEMFVDHVRNLSSSKKSVLCSSFLLFPPDPPFEVRI